MEKLDQKWINILWVKIRWIKMGRVVFGAWILGLALGGDPFPALGEETLVLETKVSTADSDPLVLSHEQRLALALLLEASGSSGVERQEMIHDFIDFMRDLEFSHQPEQIVLVNSFEEFLVHFKGDWPGRPSLREDLKELRRKTQKGKGVGKYGHILTRYVSSDPQLQERINAYIGGQSHRLESLLKTRWSTRAISLVNRLGGNGNGGKVLPGFMDIWENYKVLFSSALSFNPFAQQFINQVWETKISSLVDSVGTLFSEKISDLITISHQLSQSSEVQSLSPEMKIFVTFFLSKYFTLLSKTSKEQLVSQFLGSDLQSSSQEKFELMVSNAGPHFQKLLQMIARKEGLGPQIAAIGRKLEDSVHAVPPSIVEEILSSERANFNWESYDLKPLGNGTMAQVHSAVILDGKGKRKKVVVRFLKPGIGERAKEDKQILKMIAPLIDQELAKVGSKFPPVTPLVDQLGEMVEAELNLQETIERQKYAKRVYEKREEITIDWMEKKISLHYHVPEVIDPKGKDSGVMVQEAIQGHKLNQIPKEDLREYPYLQRMIAEGVTRLWISEIFLGSGFYHSDLQQGNFLIERKSGSEFDIHILDFGMGSRVSPQERNALVVLYIGDQIRDGDLISSALWDLAGGIKSPLTKDQLRGLVNSKIQETKGEKESPKSISEWIRWSVKSGLPISTSLTGLMRSLDIMGTLLKSGGSSKDINQITASLVRENLRFFVSLLKQDGRVTEAHLSQWGLLTTKKRLNPVVMALLKGKDRLVEGLKKKVIQGRAKTEEVACRAVLSFTSK